MRPQEIFSSTRIDRESLPQSDLDVAERVRKNPLPWKGQFSPQLVEQLLAAYAPAGGVVLDPFAGSGTSLIESARLGLAVRGFDLNPAAVILSRVYGIANLGMAGRARALAELSESLRGAIGAADDPLTKNRPPRPGGRKELEANLIGWWRRAPPGAAQDLAAALIVLCDFHRETLDAEAARRTWRRLEGIVLGLPRSVQSVVADRADARALPVAARSVDLVLTSPPYINVHNYHQQYRRSVEAMGWDVLSGARSEIGSNRQNRANRFLTVIQYSLDMALALREMARVAKKGARLILVLGRESTVRGVRFFNSELVTEIAVRSVGLEIERRQERVFRNRYGNDICEDILHFRLTGKTAGKDAALGRARRIAEQSLASAEENLPEDIREEIQNALGQADAIDPSPICVH